MCFTISAHLVPCAATASMIARSSSALKLSVLTLGLRWLCQRSRHCLPIRLTISTAMRDQFEGPCCAMSVSSRASSSGVHADLVPRAALAEEAGGEPLGVWSMGETAAVQGVEPGVSESAQPMAPQLTTAPQSSSPIAVAEWASEIALRGTAMASA